jgi:hypothetical protein
MVSRVIGFSVGFYNHALGCFAQEINSKPTACQYQQYRSTGFLDKPVKSLISDGFVKSAEIKAC